MKAHRTVWAIAGVMAAYFAPTAAMAQTAAATCTNPKALGVARTVQIDTTGGPGFGFEHYKANDFLQPKEVVLTFDDGPQKFSTEAIVAALGEECVKATFFSIGKMALGYPEIIRAVAHAGHTVGTHTWSHKALRKLKTFQEGKDEIERGVSAVNRAMGGQVAPFFRYPTLVDTPESLQYLGKRNIAMFSTDIDSFDFKIQTPESIVKTVMTKLAKNGKGIILMHDIHKTTAKAVPLLLAALKEGGYKVVHITPSKMVTTVAEYDAAIEKDAKGLPQVGRERPVSSFVKTIEGEVPEAEKAARAAQEANAKPSDAQKSSSAPTTGAAEAPVQNSAAQDPQNAQELPKNQEQTGSHAVQDAPSSETTEPEGTPTVHPNETEGSASGDQKRSDAGSTATGATEATGSIAKSRDVSLQANSIVAGEPPAGVEAQASDAARPKSWSSRAVDLWHEWFGK